jgi:OFA family oxalate/formate antiporter-like MFS transporter
MLSNTYEPITFTLYLSLVGLCFGGFLALYPSLTSDYYGSSNFGINYGVLFTAYGGGSILGPTIASYTRTFYDTYLPAFYVSTLLILVGAILTFILKAKVEV